LFAKMFQLVSLRIGIVVFLRLVVVSGQIRHDIYSGKEATFSTGSRIVRNAVASIQRRFSVTLLRVEEEATLIPQTFSLARFNVAQRRR